MLKDLTLALKNPDGRFVTSELPTDDFPTQVIPTLEKKSMEEKINEKDKQNGKKKKGFYQRHKGLVITLIVILLFALSLGGTILTFNLTKSKDAQVPNLVGKSVEDVENSLKDTKFKYEVIEEKYDVTIDKGLVISQTPEYKADYKIKEDTKIGIVVSLGQKLTIVPKVTGKTEEEAKEELNNKDLEVVVVEEFDKKVEKGIVIKQDVEPDKEVAAGITVTITVSKGIEESAVPNVTGKLKADAITELEAAGLTVATVLTTEDKTKEDGTVVKQSIEGGTTVEKGSTITITVNQIQQAVSGTVKVNLKSILGYTPKYEEKLNQTTNTIDKVAIDPQSVEVKIVVDGETVYKKLHKENETNISAPISGIGTVTIKVFVDDVLGNRTKTVNLNNEKEIVFE